MVELKKGNLSKAQGTTCVGLDNLEGLSFLFDALFIQPKQGADMLDHTKQSRLNIMSYLVNSIIFLPAILLGVALGIAQSDSEFMQGIMGLARIITLILVGIYVWLTCRRLHDADHRGEFSFGLIPPFTIFLLIYLFTAAKAEPNKWGEPVKGLTMFGLRLKGWRIVGVIIIAIFMLYLAGLFATFLFDSSTS